MDDDDGTGTDDTGFGRGVKVGPKGPSTTCQYAGFDIPGCKDKSGLIGSPTGTVMSCSGGYNPQCLSSHGILIVFILAKTSNFMENNIKNNNCLIFFFPC